MQLCGKNKSDRYIGIYWTFVCICAIAVFFTYGMCLNEHFAPDTYAHLAGYTTEHILQLHSGSGRYVAAGLVMLMDFLGIRSGTHQYIGVAALMLSSAFGAGTISYLIYGNLSEGKPDWIKAVIVLLSVLLFYINPLITEWYLFPEADMIFAFALLFTLLSSVVTYRFHSLTGSLAGAFLLCCGLNCYQTILAVYIVFAVLLEVSRSGCTWSKSNVVNVIRIILIGLLATVLSVYLTRIINRAVSIEMTNRSPVIDHLLLLVNLWVITHVQPHLWKNCLLTMPDYCLIIVAAILFFVAIFSLSAFRKQGGNRIFPGVLFLTLYLSGTYILVFAPMYFTAAIYMVHRIIPSFMTLFSVLGCIIAMNKPCPILKWLTVTVLSVFFCVNVQASQAYQRVAFVVNADDYKMTQFLVSRIDDYELTSGQTVDKIAIALDNEPNIDDRFKAYMHYGDGAKSIRTVDWAIVHAVSYASDRHFEEVEMNPQVFHEYFEGKNYDYMQDEQLVFIDDTLYLLVY